MADLSISLIKQLADLSARLSSDGDDGGAKTEALQLSKKLTASLERPEDFAVDLLFSPLLAVAARIALNLNLFKHIVDHNEPVSSGALAALSGGEELLIIRVLRPLASLGLVNEVGERTWTATPATKAMTVPGIAAGHRMIGRMIVGAAQSAPKLFEEAGYQCPVDPRNGLMQYAFQTKLTSFELFSSMPEVFDDFNTFMGSTMGARSYWFDWFPIQEQLIHASTKETPLLVDVGAGRGHDLLEFHSRFPENGPLVLQDLPAVIESIRELDTTIEPMAYDFFKEQPIKGARAYFYHHILHDWSDYKCFEILKGVKTAMKPGYSKLLIHEMLVPEQGAATFYAMLDLTMMAFNSGMERTRRQWEELLNSAGFDSVKFYPAPEEGADAIIEAMVNIT
ncbi:putative O-methyltransferase domain-containing protein [Seiridium cardinale]